MLDLTNTWVGCRHNLPFLKLIKMNNKYDWQDCQDDELNTKFGELHAELVEKVISFCKENNLEMCSFNLCAEGLPESIKINAWCPYTDSAFELWENEGEHGKPFLMSK